MNVFRRQKINEYIQANSKATYDELMALIPDISCMTLRRDLEYLEKEGSVVRVRGGARSVNSIAGENDDKYAIRAAANTAAKSDIAEKVLRYIKPEHAIYFDSGSTIMAVAGLLDSGYYNIFTPALNIALELIKKPKVDVTVLGGRLSRDTYAITGNSAVDQLGEINIDIAVLSTSGFSTDCGFTSGEYNEAYLKKAIIKKARKVIMLMDLSKYDKNMPYTFGDLKDIDVLVTEPDVPEELIQLCQAHGVELIH